MAKAKQTPRKRARRGAPAKAAKPGKAPPGSFPIVGVGASAGGLEAFERLLKRLPAKTGMAFVLVQHLDPKHESQLKTIFSRATLMPVAEVIDGMRVEPNHVYIIAPNTTLWLEGGVLRLALRKDSKSGYLPVDVLFRSLANVQKDKAIGVILSGTASDGTAGMKAIKKQGGITFAQDEDSAKYFGMAHSSIVAGAVDFVLPPEDIAKRLARIGRHPAGKLAGTKAAPARVRPEREEPLQQLFRLLRESYGVDFGSYKPSTVGRRVQRRMAQKGITRLKDYVNIASKEPHELRELYRSMFIGITSFFRTPRAFEALKKLVFPRILKGRSTDSPIRIWVPGCSTGEEVYSIAIVLLESLKSKPHNIPIEIFGTDIDEEAIKKARAGKYPEGIEADVGQQRLQRFFIKTDHEYRVSKVVRDLCIFSKHDLAGNPPFARMDLLSCRNVLIYLDAPLQRKLIPLLHYALKPSGFLMMGTAETVGGFGDLFTLVDRKHKIYAKKPGARQPFFQFTSPRSEEGKVAEAFRQSLALRTDVERQKVAADLIVLNEYAPASVLVNENMQIVQFRGHTGPYLEAAPGEASLNLFKMAREGLLVGLQAAMKAARQNNLPQRSEGLRVEFNDSEKVVNIHVVPIRSPGTDERHFLVLFEGGASTSLPSGEQKRPRSLRAVDTEMAQRVAQLKQELAATKVYLQSVIEDQEAGNEELRSLNEESLSTNEELQSTTEELETSNEELESANEELTTLNDELHNRNLQLSEAHDDILNLLSSMNMSIVFVDRDFRVRRITPTAEKVLGLAAADMGRPLRDLRFNVEIPDLEDGVLDAINSGKIKTQEIQDRDGHWLLLQTRPYLTSENKVDGAILAFTDIQELTERTRELAAANRMLQQELSLRQQAEEQARSSDKRFMLIADALPAPFSFVDTNLYYQFCNKAFEEWFGVARAQVKGRAVKDVIGAAAYETVKPSMEKALEGQRTRFEGYIFYEAEVGRRFVQIDYLPTSDNQGLFAGLYIFIHDLTLLKTAEEQLRAFVEGAPDAMIGVGTQGEIILANQQAEQVFGYTREEMVGQGHEMLVPAAAREKHLAHRTQYMKNPTARPMGTGRELYGVRKDGTEFPVEISLSPIRTREGLMISSIIRDVTDRKRLELAGRHEATLKERNRLARDVHDNLAQGLTSIVLQLEGCEQVLTQNPREAQKHIDRARSVARSSLEEARRSLVAMHAQSLDETSLPDAIEQIVSELRRESPAQIELSVSGIPYSLPIATQEHLLRVTQEALRNAIRHANASDVRVKIAYDPDAVGIRIEDNGQGFSMRKVRGGLGLGLAIMRERASEIGANFDLRSQPGKGTRVAVRMPVPPDTSKRPAE